jgi:hypothetical protein
MLTRAEGKRQRAAILRDIAREHRRTQREQLARLRQDLRDARAARSAALKLAKERCRADKRAARARARELRARLMQELRDAVRLERQGAATECRRAVEEARSLADKVSRSRAELEAERRYRRDMRRIEHGNKQRLQEAKQRTRAERQAESDEDVKVNLSPELMSLWEKVKRSIRPTPRMSRLEAFLEYAEAHPREWTASIESRTDDLICDLERRERSARRALKRPVPKTVYEDVPF